MTLKAMPTLEKTVTVVANLPILAIALLGCAEDSGWQHGDPITTDTYCEAYAVTVSRAQEGCCELGAPQNLQESLLAQCNAAWPEIAQEKIEGGEWPNYLVKFMAYRLSVVSERAQTCKPADEIRRETDERVCFGDDLNPVLCPEGTVCEQGDCFTKLAIGESCAEVESTSAGRCSPSLATCSGEPESESCRPLAGVDETCSVDQPCARHLECVSGVCTFAEPPKDYCDPYFLI